jgi:anti-anti-sigma regulatory factor
MSKRRHGQALRRFVSTSDAPDDLNGVRRFFRGIERTETPFAIVDLRKSTSISSAVCGAIIAGAWRMNASGREMRILASDALRRLLELSGASSVARVEFEKGPQAA